MIKIKLLLIAWLQIIVFQSNGQDKQSSDYKYKAVFIYNFTKYINWPANYKTGNFVVGVLGGGQFLPVLNEMLGTKMVGSQKIEVKVFAAAKDVGRCHILIVSDQKTNDQAIQLLRGAIEKIGTNSTLLITEDEGLIRSGAAISFLKKGDKITFEMNKSAVVKNKLQLSVGLERLAANVIE